MKTMRIGRVLSHLGLCSRREADKFICDNAVFYRGIKITDLNFQIPSTHPVHLKINGKNYQLNTEVEIILLNKPIGYVCTHNPQRNQKSIFLLFPDKYKSYFYAGRLDIDSRGLMLISNNGDFINKVTHPTENIQKEYYLHTSRPLSEAELNKCRRGVWQRNEKLYFNTINALKRPAHYRVTIDHGKNREIRRVLESFSVKTLDLCRVRIDNYKLGNLKSGKFKLIKSEHTGMPGQTSNYEENAW